MPGPGEPEVGELLELTVTFTADGGVVFSIMPHQDLDEQLAGVPDTRTPVGVGMIAADRWRLGRVLLANAPPEEWGPRIGEV